MYPISYLFLRIVLCISLDLQLEVSWNSNSFIWFSVTTALVCEKLLYQEYNALKVDISKQARMNQFQKK